MSHEVDEYTEKLAEALVNSEEYKRFTRIRDKVAKNPELRERINEFRIHNYQLQNSSEVLDVMEELDTMLGNYQDFRKDPMVDEFLRAELRVCRMLQEICLRVVENIDLDTEGIIAAHMAG